MKPSRRSPRNVRFGVYEVDLEGGELRKHGLKLKLSEQPFQILALLLAKPGEIVSREELRERLWPSDTFVDFDHGLNNAVMRLREVLGDSSEHPRFIETLPRRGYRFIAKVEKIAAPEKPKAPEPVVAQPVAIPAPATSDSRKMAVVSVPEPDAKSKQSFHDTSLVSRRTHTRYAIPL